MSILVSKTWAQIHRYLVEYKKQLAKQVGLGIQKFVLGIQTICIKYTKLFVLGIQKFILSIQNGLYWIYKNSY